MTRTEKRNTAIEKSCTNEIQVAQPGAPAERAHAQGPIFAPACDISDRGPEYILTADIPGCTPESVSVTFEDGVLTIQGSIQQRGPQNGCLRREYAVGDFRRQFRVGEDVNVEGIAASYAEGVLTVHLPKAAAVIPRKIAIKAA